MSEAKQRKIGFIAAMVMLLMVQACSRAAPPAPTELPATTEPTEEASLPPTPTQVSPTKEATTEPAITLDDFITQLINAWDPANRDLEFIQESMADPFFVGGPDGLIYGPLTPDDAMIQLAADGVLTDAPIPSVEWYPTVDSIAIEFTLEFDPYAAYPDAVKYLWVKESDNGQFDVLLGIGETADGSYNLINLLLVPVVTYTVDPEVFLDLALYTQGFIDAVGQGEAIRGFVPAEGVWARTADGSGDMMLLTPDEVIAFLYGTWGGGGTGGQTLSAVSTYDDVVALMGNPYDRYPDGQQFIVIDRPEPLADVVAVIQGSPEQGGYVWTELFMP